MKKFLSEIIFVFITVFIFISIFSAVLMRTNGFYNRMPEQIIIANTGTSRAMFGLSYENTAFADNSINFADSGQSLVYDFNLIDFYIDHFVDDAVLLIEVTDFILWRNELDEEKFISINQRYYDILDKKHLRLDTFDALKDYYLYKYINIFDKADDVINNFFKERDVELKTKEYTNEEKAKIFVNQHKDYYIEDGIYKEMDSASVEAIENLIDLCKNNKISPILITAPVHKLYYDCCPEGYKFRYRCFLKKLSLDYNIPWWDYSKDDRFFFSEFLFSDTYHLNEDGQELFSSIIYDRLLNEGYLHLN